MTNAQPPKTLAARLELLFALRGRRGYRPN